MAFSYKVGDPISRIKYNEDEKRTWKFCFDKLSSMFEQNACKEFKDCIV